MSRLPSSEPIVAPSLQKLNRATLIALLVGVFLLIVAVLPAEYGRDPTGIGRFLGLTQMGEMKRALDGSESTPATFVPPTVPATAATARDADVTLTLQPDEGREVKALMNAGDTFRYRWDTDGAAIRYELHGEKLDAAEGEYTSYKKGTSAGEEGAFEAPFDGTHGWYWRNRTARPVAITVVANGTFQSFAAKP